MFRTKSLAAAIGAAALAATAGIASAHTTDLAHWFEHERARTDGATEPQVPARPKDAQGNGGRPRVLMPQGNGGPTASRPDCLVEQMKWAEGYFPAAECFGTRLADERWVSDEDKETGQKRRR